MNILRDIILGFPYDLVQYNIPQYTTFWSGRMIKLLPYKFWRVNQVKPSLCITVPSSSPYFADRLPRSWDDYDWIVATNKFVQ